MLLPSIFAQLMDIPSRSLTMVGDLTVDSFDNLRYIVDDVGTMFSNLIKDLFGIIG